MTTAAALTALSLATSSGARSRDHGENVEVGVERVAQERLDVRASWNAGGGSLWS